MCRLQNKEGKDAITYAVSLRFNLFCWGGGCLFDAMQKNYFVFVIPHSTEGSEERLAPQESTRAFSNYHCSDIPSASPIAVILLCEKYLNNPWRRAQKPGGSIPGMCPHHQHEDSFSLILLQTVMSAWLVW